MGLALNSGFLCMKRLGELLLPPGWDGSPSQGYPQHICWYPFVHLGEEKHCERKVSCLRTQHSDLGQGLNPDWIGSLFLLILKQFWLETFWKMFSHVFMLLIFLHVYLRFNAWCDQTPEETGSPCRWCTWWGCHSICFERSSKRSGLFS